MQKLIDIIGDSNIETISGDQDVMIRHLQIDSRKLEKGDLYAALKGVQVDGHRYIDAAIKAGAQAVLCEQMPQDLLDGVTYIQTQNARKSLGLLAKRFFDDPSADVKLIGVTGTNGKTTIATLLYDLFTVMGYKVGLISTVENKIGHKVITSTHTTPDVVSINELLVRMRDAGCEYAFMEVSSHAIHQQRIAGLTFVGGIFTNLSHDHLDYHETFDEYLSVKKRFFDGLPKTAFALSNLDDKRGSVMLQNAVARRKTYGLRQMSNYKGKIISNTIHGLVLDINGQEAHFRMIGAFNASNLLAVYGVAMELGFESEDILTKLSMLQGAEGRFEKIIVEGSRKIGIVDYAHTPDALVNVLQTLQKVKSPSSSIITVVGCGGDRDTTKRPKMAYVAAKLSSRVILTNDNPRTEDPEKILDQMEAGLEKEQRKKVLRISDRKQAIKTAVMLADATDILLIAGKGHEKYQDINGVKYPFDDKKVLRAAVLEDA